MTGHGGAVTDLAFSEDGSMLASGSRDQGLDLAIGLGRQLALLTGHTDDVTGVTFTSDGRSLVSA